MPTLTLQDEGPEAAGEAPPAIAANPGPLRKLARLDDASFHRALRRAGRRRFEERVHRMREVIEGRDIEQALYAALMDGLGYAENRAPFGELANRLPAVLLAAIAGRSPEQLRE